MNLKNIKSRYDNWRHRRALPYNYSKMNTVTDDVVEWCKSISSDFDVVVAIPRSGLIAGSIISTYFGKPLSTPEMIIENKKWMSKKADNSNFYNRILLVDDLLWTGKQMNEVREQLRTKLPTINIRCAALYINESLTNEVNLFYKTVPDNSLCHCDYNLMHARPGKIAYDLDGVLCFDWDNISNYENHLCTVKPYRIPVYEIDCILTARLEIYRPVTEQWLKDHDVKWKKLYMRNTENQDVVQFKSEILLKENPEIYVESHPFYADLIHKETGLTVVCTDNNTMYR